MRPSLCRPSDSIFCDAMGSNQITLNVTDFNAGPDRRFPPWRIDPTPDA